MSGAYESERREFVRVKTEILVRYKFLCTYKEDKIFEEIHQGYTSNLSGGGILLKGPVPDFNWIPDLLMQKTVIGVNMMLPTEQEPLKALTRVAWIEAIDEKTHTCILGLKFKEITREDQDKIFKYIIRSQMPS
ncbi:MAG: PilZ domain-containing protein [Planctomycetes bacterium]|nr:PilZ domain-containing protein [Planctomycetota bacterium]